MNLVRRSLGAVLFWIALVPCCSRAQRANVIKLNAYLDQAHQAGLFNGNVLVVARGKVILQRALGYANGSQTMPLSLSDRFQVGSIAKEFDAVGILMLAQDGKLALTDPVSKFFPGLPSWAATVTINDLLHYTSGLPDVKWDSVNSDADNWKDLYALQKLKFAPSSEYFYNNNDVFLRKRVIEKVSGTSFAEFVTKRELPKAGIRNAVIDPTNAEPLMARSFDAKHNQEPLTPPVSGWVSLSLNDLLRWSNCIVTFCLISPSSTRQIVTTQDPTRQTGLGHTEMSGDKVISHVHDGSVRHYQALLMMTASKDRTVIILTNRRQDNIYEMGHAIEAILDNKQYVPLTVVKNK